MAYSKVILNGTTLMDTTDKTVTAGAMTYGTTALKNDGTTVTGSIASKSSSDLTTSGATVTAPAGYYASSASKSVASGSATTPSTSITANPSISVSSGGLITASVSASQSVTPAVSAGYVSSGTAGTVSVSGSNTEQLTAQAAQTIHPSTTDQTIASGKYLTGAQTIKAVTISNTLTAANVASGVVVEIGDADDADRLLSITGTHSGGGGSSYTLLAEQEFTVNTTSTSTTTVGNISIQGIKNYIDSHEKIVFTKIFDKAGERNGYYYGGVFFNVLSNTAFGQTYYIKSSGALDYSSIQYGVFVSAISQDSITISSRYVSSFGNLNGTFHATVYAIDWPNNASPFS